MQSVTRPLAIGLGLLFASACARTNPDVVPPSEPEPADAEPVAAEPTPAPATPDLIVTGIYLSPEIQQACKVTMTKAFFEFDSAAIDNPDSQSLQRVAECLATGPLKDRKVILVGHADPRGTDEYNQKLGKTRAQALQGYLADKGVELGKITTESRGEQNTDPTDPSEWPYDRRVDISLAAP